jgi:hypothetical protein
MAPNFSLATSADWTIPIEFFAVSDYLIQRHVSVFKHLILSELAVFKRCQLHPS